MVIRLKDARRVAKALRENRHPPGPARAANRRVPVPARGARSVPTRPKGIPHAAVSHKRRRPAPQPVVAVPDLASPKAAEIAGVVAGQAGMTTGSLVAHRRTNLSWPAWQGINSHHGYR